MNGIESDVKKKKYTKKPKKQLYATVGSLTGFFGVCIEQQLDPLLI